MVFSAIFWLYSELGTETAKSFSPVRQVKSACTLIERILYDDDLA